MWAIVEFTEEENVAVVPESWICEGGLIRWPPAPKDPSKCAANAMKPADSWKLFPAKVMKHYGKHIVRNVIILLTFNKIHRESVQ